MIPVEKQKTLVNLDYEVKISERDNNGLTVFDLLRRIPDLKMLFVLETIGSLSVRQLKK